MVQIMDNGMIVDNFLIDCKVFVKIITFKFPPAAVSQHDKNTCWAFNYVPAYKLIRT